MFREMRRKDRQIDDAAVISLLLKCDYGVLSTVDENGYPYGVPLSYAYANNAIYFHCALEGQKLDNIKGNDKVSFTIIGEVEALPSKFSTRYESVIVFGSAAEVFEEEKYNALVTILDKYSKNYMEQGKAYIKNDIDKTKVIKISIEHVTGKARK
jgi:uncharacterized protein